jgi:hypothetical protein
MTTNQETGIQQRSTWEVLYRVAGLVGILAALVTVIGLSTFSRSITFAGFFIFLLGLSIAVGTGIAYTAMLPKLAKR